MTKKALNEKQLADENKKLKRKIGELTRKIARLRKQIKTKQFEAEEQDDHDDELGELLQTPVPEKKTDYCPRCGDKDTDVIKLETAVDVRYFLLCKGCDLRKRIKTERKQ